jgi:hypothetical protein
LKYTYSDEALGVVVWFYQSDGLDQKTISPSFALASRKKAYRMASTLTMGMPPDGRPDRTPFQRAAGEFFRGETLQSWRTLISR